MAYVDFIMKVHKSTKRDYSAASRARQGRGAPRSPAGSTPTTGTATGAPATAATDTTAAGARVAEDMARHYTRARAHGSSTSAAARGSCSTNSPRSFPHSRSPASTSPVRDRERQGGSQAVPPGRPCGRAPLSRQLVRLRLLDQYPAQPVYLRSSRRYRRDRTRRPRRQAHRDRGIPQRREKVNLIYWQLTCRAFHTPDEWEWRLQQAGYSGDYSYIVFDF